MPPPTAVAPDAMPTEESPSNPPVGFADELLREYVSPTLADAGIG
jgi:hypothetical protein